MSDADPEVDDMDAFNVFLKDFPSGTGWRNIVYYAQTVHDTGELRRFDYGSIRNFDHYDSVKPPMVPLDQLNIPTPLFVGEYDNFATVKDNEWLVT